jgi:hypothetical protein
MASADLFGRVRPPADTADLRMMLCSSFALACTTVLVRKRRASNTKSLVSGVYSPLWSHPRSEVLVARQASDQLADADQGIVFLLLSLLEAYLCAIEEEASVTLRYLQTLPL